MWEAMGERRCGASGRWVGVLAFGDLIAGWLFVVFLSSSSSFFFFFFSLSLFSFFFFALVHQVVGGWVCWRLGT